MRSEILNEFQLVKRLTAGELKAKFGVSRQAIHRHLKVLQREGRILKLGTSPKNTFYLLNTPEALAELKQGPRKFDKRYRAEGLQEDMVYHELERRPFLLAALSDNARALFHYAFTEMLNNAIDHAETSFVDVNVAVTPYDAQFVVKDTGVGIFENIRAKKTLSDEMEAIQDLLKGKQTTMPEYHSGEGIFFTSKIADRLIIQSHRKGLIIDNRMKDIFIEDIRRLKGTRVVFELNSHATHKLTDIFKTYTNEDYQFDKSEVTVKLYQRGDPYISRSQAKRLVHALEQFREITLDFKGVTTIGQGFADEIFRVFANRYPGIRLKPINCHENVHFMIERARQGTSDD